MHLAQSDPFMPALFTLGVALLIVTSIFPGWLLAICIVFSFLTGRTGLSVGYWEIFALALVARWLLIVPFTGDLFGKVRAKLTLACIAGFTMVLMVHGLRAFMNVGGGLGGKRLALVAVAALGMSYLLLSHKVDLSRLPTLPWLGLLPGLVATSFDLINILIPAALPITYFIYNEQNWEIIAQFQGANVELLRLSGFRELGLGIGVLALTYFAFQREFKLGRLLGQVGAALLGAIFIVVAGYRMYVARLGVGILVAAYCRSKATFLAVCIAGFLSLGSLIYIHNNIIDLPLPVQRALSFLPGDWDWRTKSSAEGGWEWREELRAVFFTKIFPHNWLLGRGLVYEERLPSMTWMNASPSYQIDYFVAMQCYHSGLASATDFVGVFGVACLLVGCFRGLWNSYVLVTARDRIRRWHLWTAIMFITFMPYFWYTGFFERDFPFIAMFMCLLELARDDIKKQEVSITASADVPADYEMETAART
jgi:hypothetical protein